MAKWRKKTRRRKNNNADPVSAIVGLVAFLVFAYGIQFNFVVGIGLALLVLIGAIAGLIIYSRHKSESPTKSSFARTSVQRPYSPTPTLSQLKQELDRNLNKTVAKADTKPTEWSLERMNKTVAKAETKPTEWSLERMNKTVAKADTKPTEWSLELIKSLDWKRFEELCAAYFQAKGRKAKVTNLGADGGIDVLLYENSDSEKLLGVVQCKAWTQKPVGVKQIRELLGIMTDAGCPLGVYVTTSGYTPDAKAFAENKHIKLMTAADLLKLIHQLPADVQSKLLKQTTAGDYTTPSCPNCGTKLILRTSRRGNRPGQKFWGCRNYPRCRYIMQAKSA